MRDAPKPFLVWKQILNQSFNLSGCTQQVQIAVFSPNWKKNSIMMCIFELYGCSFTPLNNPTWASMGISNIGDVELWNSPQKILVIKEHPVMIWNLSWKCRKSALWARRVILFPKVIPRTTPLRNLSLTERRRGKEWAQSLKGKFSKLSNNASWMPIHCIGCKMLVIECWIKMSIFPFSNLLG